MPNASNGTASRPRRPKTRRRANPATDGGRTMGRSIIASTRPLPRNCRRAMTKARGSPNATVIPRLMAVVTRLNDSASRTAGDAIASWREPSRIARATSVSTGSPRNSARSPATATSEPSPQPARSTRVSVDRATLEGAFPGLPAASVLTSAAGTRSCPGSPGRRVPRTRPGTTWRPPHSETP